MNTSASSALPAVGARDHVTGSNSPELTLVEYGDFGCPYCFAASRPGKSLLDRFDGLRLVWRHFPVPELHPRADLAAELCELAGLHGKFWDAHSLLLTPRGRFSRDDLLSAAGRLELDPAETHAALGELRFRERVLADIEGGRRAGVNATPTFFLDGERLDPGPGANSRRSCEQASQVPNRPVLTSRAPSGRPIRRPRAASPRHSETSSGPKLAPHR